MRGVACDTSLLTHRLTDSRPHLAHAGDERRLDDGVEGAFVLPGADGEEDEGHDHGEHHHRVEHHEEDLRLGEALRVGLVLEEDLQAGGGTRRAWAV